MIYLSYSEVFKLNKQPVTEKSALKNPITANQNLRKGCIERVSQSLTQKYSGIGVVPIKQGCSLNVFITIKGYQENQASPDLPYSTSISCATIIYGKELSSLLLLHQIIVFMFLGLLMFPNIKGHPSLQSSRSWILFILFPSGL